MDDENKLSNTSQPKDGEKGSGKNKNGSSAENKSTEACVNQDNDNNRIARSEETVSGVDVVSGALEHVNINSGPPECEGKSCCFLILIFKF